MAADNSHGSKTEMKPVASRIKCTIRKNLIESLLEESFQNKIKITNDALNLVVEVANCIVIETCMRAANQARKGDSKIVKFEHVQECLPQLMLDFP